MKNYEELILDIVRFETSGGSSELNAIRTNIFDLYDLNSITTKIKDHLLKELYAIATRRGIFFMRVTERVKPEVEEEEYDDEYEESYEESYSYDDEEEEEDE